MRVKGGAEDLGEAGCGGYKTEHQTRGLAQNKTLPTVNRKSTSRIETDM
jgi:hypothetical protein